MSRLSLGIKTGLHFFYGVKACVQRKVALESNSKWNWNPKWKPKLLFEMEIGTKFYTLVNLIQACVFFSLGGVLKFGGRLGLTGGVVTDPESIGAWQLMAGWGQEDQKC